jgi:uncharacterized small protein (DUF1192 family)
MDMIRGLPPVEIFRVGNYGPKGQYTVADLQQIADDYNAKQVSPDPQDRKQAPFKFDHSGTGPAAGFISSLMVNGNSLYAVPEYVPALIGTLKSGAYRNRSVEIVKRPDGKLELQAVALLGAARPEVGGLAPMQFAQAESFETIESEFSDPITFSQQSISEPANKTIQPKTTQTRTKERNMDPVIPEGKPIDGGQIQSIEMIKFAEIAEKNAILQAQVEQLRKERDQKDAELKAEQGAKNFRTFNENYNALRELGILPDHTRNAFMAIFNRLESSANNVIKFSDDQPSMTYGEALFHALRQIPPVAENLRGVDVKTFAEGGKKKSMEEDDLEEISEELFESKVAAEAKKLAKEMAESNGNKPNENMLDATKMAEKNMFAQYRIKGRK